MLNSFTDLLVSGLLKACSAPVHKPVPVEEVRKTTDNRLENLGYLRSKVFYPMEGQIKKFELGGVHCVSNAETMTS